MSIKAKQTIRFTFLCSPHERQLLSTIAEHLGRSQGDAVRLLIRIAAQEFNIAQKTGHEGCQQPVGASLSEKVQTNL